MKVWINITTDDGTVLERIAILADDEDKDEKDLARKVVERLERFFMVED